MKSRPGPEILASVLVGLLLAARSARGFDGTPEGPPPAGGEPSRAAVGRTPLGPGAGLAHGGDIVESIDSAPATPPAPEPPAPFYPATVRAPTTESVSAMPALPDRFELHGWARQSLELGLSKAALHTDDPDPTALPYDRLTARSQLFMRARYSRARWFEANVSGVLSYSIFEQGPARASTPFNGFNGRTARGVLEPELYELFTGFFTDSFDFRVGQQRVAWGKGEFMSPNDVVNARDRRDPFVGETELRALPTFMLRGDLDLGFGTLEGIVAPLFTPDRFDVFGSNWAGVQPDAPAWVRGVVNIVRRSFDPSVREPEQRLLMATRYPKSNLTDPVLSARLSWSAAGVDVNYYYQYGFDGPLIALDPALAMRFASLDFTTAGLADLQPLLEAIDAGQKPFQATYVRSHHVGTDLATTLGPFAVRLDAAYESKRVFFRRDLLGAVSPSFAGVASVEYQTGDKDKLILLEGIYLRVLDGPPAPLLIYDRDSVGIAGNLRWPLWDPVGFELRALIGLEPRTAVIQPQFNVKFDPLVVSAGGLWLDGEPYSFGNHFHRNREVYLKTKYLF